jgi:uncharacterized protein
MIISELYIYPIKSCRGIRLERAEVTPKGFFLDREFMLVDAKGKFLSQREYPQLATIEIKIIEDTFLLSSSTSFSFKPTLTGREIAVKIWRDSTVAIDQGDKVARWFQNILGIKNECRLVRQSPKQIRAIDKQYATQENEPVSFADGYPFLLTNTASLDELNRRINLVYPDRSQEVVMNRFRPNITIDSDKPFLEGEWKLIQLGEVKFAVVKPCSRCIITTTNQLSGERNALGEPLKTLRTFRRFGNAGIMFGENLIPKTTGVVAVGDRLNIIESK